MTDDEIRFSRINKYIEARKNGDTEACLRLVSDNIFFESERDGTYSGKAEFRSYLQKVKFEGTWNIPEKTGLNQYTIHGKVKILFIQISVKIVMSFDDNNLISIAKIMRG